MEVAGASNRRCRFYFKPRHESAVAQLSTLPHDNTHYTMARIVTILLLMVLLLPGIAYAKRKAAPKIEPLIYAGVRYVAPNNDGRRAYVQAWDTVNNKMVWEVTVFRNFINPLAEEDVQHVYIKKMSVLDEKLILIAEDDRAYSVDLKTRVVKSLKQAPAGKPQANQSGAVSLQYAEIIPFSLLDGMEEGKRKDYYVTVRSNAVWGLEAMNIPQIGKHNEDGAKLSEAANPAIALWLQSMPPACRGA